MLAEVSFMRIKDDTAGSGADFEFLVHIFALEDSKIGPLLKFSGDPVCRDGSQGRRFSCIMSTATLDRSRLRKQLAIPFTLPAGATPCMAPSTTSLDSPGAEMGNLVGGDEP